jgi:hypothetical protein
MATVEWIRAATPLGTSMVEREKRRIVDPPLLRNPGQLPAETPAVDCPLGAPL